MNRLLFLSPLGIDNEASGLSKKIRNQINYFKSENIEVDLVTIKKNDSLVTKVRTRLPYTGVYDWPVGMSENQIKQYGSIYIRYHASDCQLIRFLKKVKKTNPQIKVLVEIPTYPYGDESDRKISRGVHINKDIKYRKHLHKYVDYIVTFSKDKEIFNVPTITISNTVDFQTVSLKKQVSSPGELNLIAVGSLYFWHGYDRVIEGLKEYYSEGKRTPEVRLHLVGGGPEYQSYKQLVEEYQLEHHVKLYGPLQGAELDAVYDVSDIGLDSMGRHRSKVYYNSSLKGKEYGAKGLPIVSGVETELDFYPDFDFYKRVPADDSPIDIESVVNFYENLKTNYAVEDLNHKIRTFNEKEFNQNRSWGKVTKIIK